jgi:uncharacterized protein (TIGR00369 family)
MTTAEAHFAEAARLRRFLQTDAAVETLQGVSKLFKRRIVTIDEAAREVAVEFTVPAEFTTFTGSAHGGATATMIDEAASTAVIVRFGLHCFKGTTTMAVQYLRPVMPGTVTCRARVIREGKDIVFVECAAYDDKGRLLAKAQATASIDFSRPISEFTPSGRRFAYLEYEAPPEESPES